MEKIFYLFSFLFGLAIGSFLNVLTLRFKPEENFSILNSLKGRSRCPYCKTPLKWFELIPVFSFLVQRGRCRYCKKKISWQYPIVEFFSGLIFALVAWHWYSIYSFYNFKSLIFFTLLWWFYFSLFLALSIIDLRYYLVPQSLLDLFFLGAIFSSILFGFHVLTPPKSFIGYYSHFLFSSGNFFLDSLLGAILVGGFLYLLVKITKEKAIGMGDVKIFFILSFIFPWPEILVVFSLSFILGGLFSTILILLKKKNIKAKVPFAPFIFLAALIVFLFGFKILNFYFDLV